MTDLIAAVRALSRQCRSILQFEAFETATPEGRSKERYRRVALTALSAGGAKAIAILTMLISVPLTLNYLGTERYGMWMTIGSVVLMLNFADLGVGLGLMNAISEAHGRDDRRTAAGYVSSAFFLLCGIAVVIMTVFTLAYPHLPWPRLFNVKTALAVQEAGPALAAFVFCFVLNLPLGVVQRVQMGYQDGFVNSIWEALGKIMGLIGVLVVIYFRGGLAWLVLAMAGAPALASLLNSLVLFGYNRPWLRPRWQMMSWLGAAKIFKLGILFFILQMSGALAFASDNLVVAQILGSEAVSQYAVPMRMFGVLSMLSGFLVAPLWPAYGEAVTRGDIVWVKKTLHRSLKLTLIVVGLPSILLVFLGAKILHLWVGPEIQTSLLLLLGLGLWINLSSMGNTLAIFLNGISVLKFQIICGLFMATFAILFKTIFALKIGLPGIIWGTNLAYILFILTPFVLYMPKIFRHVLKEG